MPLPSLAESSSEVGGSVKRPFRSFVENRLALHYLQAYCVKN